MLFPIVHKQVVFCVNMPAWQALVNAKVINKLETGCCEGEVL